MEINPYDSRLRMLQQIDGVQMQREAAPDEEAAGCPGCPFFWTCPVPHRGEEVRAPREIELEDVRGELSERREYRPRDESDVGWTDVWVDEAGNRIEDPTIPDHVAPRKPSEPHEQDHEAEDPNPGKQGAEDRGPEQPRRSGWRLLRRRGRRG